MTTKHKKPKAESANPLAAAKPERTRKARSVVAGGDPSPVMPEYRGPRCVVMMSLAAGARQAHLPLPPQPQEDLLYRGGRTLAQLSYKTFYVEKSFAQEPLASARAQLDTALAAAMTDPALNEIVGQYFGNGTISTTPLPSIVLDVAHRPIVDKGDVHALAERTFMSGALAGIDLNTCVINFVLPPGVILSSEGGPAARTSAGRVRAGTPEAEEADSKNGLGGYHGSVHIAHPGRRITIYYSVAVWSEADNGIPIPGWQSWENVCATLYHELNEARTDPDVEDASLTGDLRWIGWNSRSGQEIGDFPIEEAGSNLALVFQKVAVNDPVGTAPIQVMWSNRIHGPEAPGTRQEAVAAAATSLPILDLSSSASAALAGGAGIMLAAPGKVSDFKKEASGRDWSTKLSKFFDAAIAETQTRLQGRPSQFFNPARGTPAGPATELQIRWPAFPRQLENSDLSPEEQLQRAELISGTFLGRLQFQDEYLEWFVTRDEATGRITRIDFTCEGPEYWDFLAHHEPQVLLSLYQEHVDRGVRLADLIQGGRYNPLNVWNTRRGAVHLIQPSNSLNAEVKIAADATILRRGPDGAPLTDAQDLIECAKFGVAARASDPHIGDLINGLARDGYVISIKDPVGLYMSRPRLTGCTTPDGKQISQDWFKVTRGSEAFILHGVFEAPSGSPFVAGDVAIGGVPVAFGGQIAKLIDMSLTGVAFAKGSIRNPTFPCEPGDALVASATMARSLGRIA